MYVVHEGFLLKVIGEVKHNKRDYFICTDFEEEEIKMPVSETTLIHELIDDFNPKPGDFLVTQFGDVVRFIRFTDEDKYLTEMCGGATLFEASSKNFIYKIPNVII